MVMLEGRTLFHVMCFQLGIYYSKNWDFIGVSAFLSRRYADVMLYHPSLLLPSDSVKQTGLYAIR